MSYPLILLSCVPHLISANFIIMCSTSYMGKKKKKKKTKLFNRLNSKYELDNQIQNKPQMKGQITTRRIRSTRIKIEISFPFFFFLQVKQQKQQAITGPSSEKGFRSTPNLGNNTEKNPVSAENQNQKKFKKKIRNCCLLR